jgi:hypothetical protein
LQSRAAATDKSGVSDRPPFSPDADVPDGDRRVKSDRRDQPRGGRRRADRPEDAGLTACPRCSDPYPALVDIDLHEYQWSCEACGARFVTQRATRVVL